MSRSIEAVSPVLPRNGHVHTLGNGKARSILKLYRPPQHTREPGELSHDPIEELLMCGEDTGAGLSCIPIGLRFKEKGRFRGGGRFLTVRGKTMLMSKRRNLAASKEVVVRTVSDSICHPVRSRRANNLSATRCLREPGQAMCSTDESCRPLGERQCLAQQVIVRL